MSRYKNRIIRNLIYRKSNFAPKRNHNLLRLLSRLSRKYKFTVQNLIVYYTNLFKDLNYDNLQKINKLRLANLNTAEFDHYNDLYGKLTDREYHKRIAIYRIFTRYGGNFYYYPKIVGRENAREK